MKTFVQSIKITLMLCVILCGGYVFLLWGFASVFKTNNGNVEMVRLNNKVVGAQNVGQDFSSLKYFHGRPSAVDYKADNSGGSNKGVSNDEYLAKVEDRINQFIKDHPYLKKEQIPSEMVTASGSGLDPDISPEAVKVQIERVAKSRNVDRKKVEDIVDINIEKPLFGVPYVNVLKLNVALDNSLK